MQDQLIQELRKYLLKYLGLNFSERSTNDLYKKMTAAAQDFNFSDTNSFINWLLKTKLDSRQTEKLSSFLTIGETYFFREAKTLEYLEKVYLPGLIKKRKNKLQYLRIWSAGCATGEEPYSVAIMLKRIIPDVKNWNITILATDINANFIEKAKTGIYSNYSFRKTQDSFREKNFTEVERNRFRILPEYSEMVSFEYVNLATDSYPSLVNNTNAMDVILCRNVLIYFSEDGIRQVSRQLFDSLIRDGILLVSPVEMTNLIFPGFHRVFYEGNTIYIKEALYIKDQKAMPEESFSFKPKKNKIRKPERKEPVSAKMEAKNPQLPGKPKNEKVLYNQANDLFRKKDFQATKDLLGEIDKEEKNIDAAKLLIRTEANLGNLEFALSLCALELKKNKLDPDLYFLQANIQQELRKEHEAIDSLKRVIYLDPEYVLAYFSLGLLYSGKDRDNRSTQYYKNALKLISKHQPDETLSMADGLTAGRLTEIIKRII